MSGVLHGALLAASTVRPSVTYKAAAGANSTSVAIPSHNVGDLIVVWTHGTSVSPTKPTASGTVPAWVDIASDTRQRLTYFVATATNTTTGTWTNSIRIVAVVLSGQAGSPIGGNALRNGNSTSTVVVPSATLRNSDGTSQILHFANAGQATTPLFTDTFSVSGYTVRLGGVGGNGNNTGFRLVTKNSTTSAESITIGTSIGTQWNASATLEIASY
jgi:hypothetical protein